MRDALWGSGDPPRTVRWRRVAQPEPGEEGGVGKLGEGGPEGPAGRGGRDPSSVAPGGLHQGHIKTQQLPKID